MAAYRKLDRRSGAGVTVIPGMEVRTDRGDVIGLFLCREIESRHFGDVVREIRDQGGIVVLPHPYRRKCDPADLVGEADLVEVINCRSSAARNASALALCGCFGRQPVAGSDAHACFEIGRAVTEIEGRCEDLPGLKDALLHGARRCYGRAAPWYVSCGISLFASRVKRLQSSMCKEVSGHA